MFCSTIIPTVGRPSLDRAVNSVLEQEFKADEFEVIVVNDSGRPLSPVDWYRSPHVQIIKTQQRERGAARNVGATVARGDYLHFLDDDDWLAQGGLVILQGQAQRQPEAVLVYGGAQLVDRQANSLIQLDPALQGNVLIKTLAGEWLPLQASLIRTDAFWEIGGFDPLIPGIEDIDLARRLTLHGDVVGTPEIVVFVGMGEEDSTTDRAAAHLLGQAARERIFEDAGTWQRLWASADSAYWQGRIARAYLTSAVWNGRQGLIATAVSRMAWATMSLTVSSWNVLHKEYWQAVLRPHQSKAFARGIEKANA